MNKLFFKKQATALLLGLGLCIIPVSSHAVVAQNTDDCSKEILLSYFPAPYVKETLKKFNIPQNKWDSIVTALSITDKTIISDVENKANKIRPNMMKDPQQRQAVVKLFRETLLKAFGDAMKSNGITDEKNFQAMLDDIQQQKAKAFARCMEKHKNDKPASTPQNMQN